MENKLIEGFKIDVASEELRDLLRKQATRIREKAAAVEGCLAQLGEYRDPTAKRQSPAAVALAEAVGMEIDDVGHVHHSCLGPPIGGIGHDLDALAQVERTAKQFLKSAQQGAEALDFIAKHLVAGATYRLNATALSAVLGFGDYGGMHAVLPGNKMDIFA